MEALNSFIVERRGRPRLAIACPARLRPNDWSTAQVEMLDTRNDIRKTLGLAPKSR